MFILPGSLFGTSLLRSLISNRPYLENDAEYVHCPLQTLFNVTELLDHLRSDGHYHDDLHHSL